MIKNKSILIAIPTLGAGGMERAAVNMALSLDASDNKVSFFLLLGGEPFYSLPEHIQVFYGKKKISDKFSNIKSLIKLRKYVSVNKPDAIFSFSGMHSVYVIIATLFLKTKVFVFHRSNPNVVYGKINDVLNRIFFPYAAALVVQTETANQIFQKKYHTDKIIIFPNIVRALSNIEIDYSSHTIVSITRLVPGKGVIELIRMFSKIRFDDWILLFVGDGPLRSEAESLIGELHMEPYVFLMGFQSNVDSFIERSSIFAFASESEGFPNALLEAMSQGLACISFDCPTGPGDMIDDGINGYLIPVNEFDTYKSKLHELMTDESLRSKFGHNAKSLRIKHSSDTVMPQFLTDIESYL